ncbi:hypothetical protein [Providencia phage vB_PreS-PatoteraRojo]|nr:hypothetical protein [Providencia phage vB_PreS-PatoteraRojo]
MRTIKRNGAIVLKRLGITYFVLVNGRNVFEIDADYDKAKEAFDHLNTMRESLVTIKEQLNK